MLVGSSSSLTGLGIGKERIRIIGRETAVHWTLKTVKFLDLEPLC